MRRFPKSVLPHRSLVIAASTAVLLLSAALVSSAEAGVRVSVDVRLPHVGVDVNTPVLRCGMPPVRPVERVEIIITRSDRQTARALARQYDCCRVMLLDMRRAGYRWHEIREILDRPPRHARAILHPFQVSHLSCGDRDDDHRDRKHHRSRHQGDCRD